MTNALSGHSTRRQFVAFSVSAMLALTGCASAGNQEPDNESSVAAGEAVKEPSATGDDERAEQEQARSRAQFRKRYVRQVRSDIPGAAAYTDSEILSMAGHSCVFDSVKQVVRIDALDGFKQIAARHRADLAGLALKSRLCD